MGTAHWEMIGINMNKHHVSVCTINGEGSEEWLGVLACTAPVCTEGSDDETCTTATIRPVEGLNRLARGRMRPYDRC